MYEQSELCEVLAKMGARLHELAHQVADQVDGRTKMSLVAEINAVGTYLEDIAEQHGWDEDTDFFDTDSAEFLAGDDGRPEVIPLTRKQPTTGKE